MTESTAGDDVIRVGQDARGLSVIAPGLLGPDYFHEIAEVVNAGGPPNVQRIMDVMRRHGLRPAPPVT